MDVIRMILFLALGPSVSSLELTGKSVHDARLGSDARVPCWFTVDEPPVDLNHLTIFWNVRDKEILSYNKIVTTTSPRYSLDTKALPFGISILVISRVRISDGGNYKCSVIYGSERKEKRVWLDIRAPPQVTITDKTVVLNVESVLRCSATGFFTPDIGIKWFRDGEKLEDNIIVGDPLRNPDRTYSVNSTVTITPTEEDRERIFSCRVQHKYLQELFQKDFRLVYEDRSSAGFIAACSVLVVVILIIIIAAVLWWRLRRKVIEPFIARDIAGPPKLIDGEEAALYCTVDNAPEDLCVTWLMRRDGQDQEIQTSQMREHSEEEESLLDTSYVIRSQRLKCQYSSSLSFIPHMERHKDVTFICRGASGKRTDEKTFYCKTIYGKPKMSLPIIRSLFVCGKMKYLLNLEKFYPKSINIIWTCGERGAGEVLLSTDSISVSPDRSYKVSSEVVIPEDRHKDPEFRVRVTWHHESMEMPESWELFIRDSDYRWTPVVEEILIPHLLHGSPAVLQCNISGYFPDAVTVKWMRRDGDKLHEETDDNQRITSRRAADNTYSRTASVTITPDLRTHQGAEYICLVEHPSLETPIERSSVRLRVYDYRWTPVVEDILTPRLLHGYPAVLQCNISDYFPDAITVKWMRRDGDKLHEETDDNQRIMSRRAADNTYIHTASLTITPSLRTHRGAEYICLVEHPSLETPIERSTGRLRVYGKPQMSAPIEITMADPYRVHFSLNLQKFYPKDIKISWSRKDSTGEYGLTAKNTVSTRDNYLTYEVTSVVLVPGYRFIDPEIKFIVEWKHESMETSETISLSVRDLPWSPHVGSLNVP